jgi:butyrate kinase
MKEVASMVFRILAVNPGSTSTKISVFDDQKNIMTENIKHAEMDLAALHGFDEQFQYRKTVILQLLEDKGIDIAEMSAVVGRGGMMCPVQPGAYRVNEAMKRDLQDCPKYNASNLGAFLADELAAKANAPAFIYDSVAVDELWELTRLTGLPGVERTSIGHALNMRSVARQWADQTMKSYQSVTLIVAHLGGGITASLHHNGKMVDMISDDEGSFGPERSGMVPARKLIKHIFAHGMNEQEAFDSLQGKSAGLHGMLGTANTIEVEMKIAAGDKKALLCYESMAFNVAKAIGQLATEVSGKVDQIILTGGTAYSPQFTGWIKDRVSFIAPVKIMPGEMELEAMAMGALHVLRGEEPAQEYVHKERTPLV